MQKDFYGFIEAHPGVIPPAEPWPVSMLAGIRLQFFWLNLAFTLALLVRERSGIFKRRFYFCAVALATVTALGWLY
jgi:hypothetical protein